MKKLTYSIVISALVLGACNNNKDKTAHADSTRSMSADNDMMTVVKPTVKSGKYVNLTSGSEVYIMPDPVTGIAIDSTTQLPVEFYYDPITLDTLYQNGLKVNHMLVNLGEGKYKLDDMKIKIDGDEIKIKTDSSKLKVDNDTYKMKSGDNKIKVTDDVAKQKDANGKVKVEDDEVKVKPNN